MHRQRGTTIRRLRRLFGIKSSEKTRDVLPPKGASKKPDGCDAPKTHDDGGRTCQGGSSSPESKTPEAAASSSPKRRVGHGRIAAADYLQATHIPVPHETLEAGQRCPSCHRGKLYRLKTPAPILRITGSAPLVATCYDCERLRYGRAFWDLKSRAPYKWGDQVPWIGFVGGQNLLCNRSCPNHWQSLLQNAECCTTKVSEVMIDQRKKS
jgi:hypothetical protein